MFRIFVRFTRGASKLLRIWTSTYIPFLTWTRNYDRFF